MALIRRETQIPPISVPPSQSFQGSDGSWSTFLINVGNPPQTFNVLISTSGQETWVPSASSCNLTDDICGEGRGAQPFNKKPSRGFQVNESSTWEDMGTFAVGLGSNLNYTGQGLYGLDTVGLGLPTNPGIKLPGQVVGDIRSKDFYFGQLGLGPKPTNFSDFNNPRQSFMWSLKNSSSIPSISFGYTAGAPYRLKKALGSLTLGGYDSSLFVPNGMNFTFSPDDSKSLTVGLQSINATNTLNRDASGNAVQLLPSTILSLIDSSVPDIWLPEAACSRFEEAFGLQFDENTNRYRVNNSIHTELLQRNPVITFGLANSIAGKAIQISLPYQAFDLQASFPVYPAPTRFFPLRRAVNDTQYTLGRAFLQEAYVVADYERSQFWVAQTVFNENNPSKLVPINPPGFESRSRNQKAPVNTTLIAIILAALGGIMLLTMGLIWVFRSRRRRKMRDLGLLAAANLTESGISLNKAPKEMVIGPPVELMGGPIRHELGGAGMRHELPDRGIVVELSARPYR